MEQSKKTVFTSYESPMLITYGKVEDLTQMPKKDKPGNGGGSGGNPNKKKVFGTDDSSKSFII